MKPGKNSPIGKVNSEDWFAELYRNLPVDDSEVVLRCDNFDEAFLRELVGASRKPSLLDPRVKPRFPLFLVLAPVDGVAPGITARAKSKEGSP